MAATRSFALPGDVEASVSAGERGDFRAVRGRVDDRLAASELFAGMMAVLAPGPSSRA
jgi:hypothetical protein